MLKVTDDAKQFLSSALGKMRSDEHEDEVFRLARSKDARIALVTGLPTDDDLHVTHQDETVLVVEKDLADSLEGRTLDVEEKEDNARVLVMS